MLLSSPSRGPCMEKFLSQNAYYEIKNFTKLVTEYLIKFEMKIHEYFPSQSKNGFVYIRNPFTANAQMLQTETGTQEEQVKL